MPETHRVAKRRLSNRVLWGIGIAAFAGLSAFAWWLLPQRFSFYTDTDSIRQPTHAVVPRDILWQPPKPLSEPVNSQTDDYEPRLSSDGLTIYYVRGKAGQNADIYFARRTRDGWGEPQSVPGLNGEYDDLGPEPSADGERIYFYSNRPGGHGGYDLWVARCGPDGCEPPTNPGSAVNSEFNDYGPALAPDGRTIYFASNRPRQTDTIGPKPDAWPATVREDLYQRDYDLYSARIEDGDHQAAVPLDVLNSPYNEGAPAASPVGDFLYFASDRPGGVGGFDLYRSRRRAGELLPPANLGLDVNTPANELDPALTLGGFGLCFSSDRRSAAKSPDGDQDYDLYYTASREVFRDVETVQRAGIDWAAFWKYAGPALLWALLTLLLLLLAWILWGNLRQHKLSLLAKCLLASMFLHLLLLMLFNLWQVAAVLADHYGGRGTIQVALLPSSGSGEGLASQIRGQLTEVQVSVVEPLSMPSPMSPPAPSIDSQTFDLSPPSIDKPAEHRVNTAARLTDARLLSSSSVPAHVLEIPNWNPPPELGLPSPDERPARAEPESTIVSPPAGLSAATTPRPAVATEQNLSLAIAELVPTRSAEARERIAPELRAANPLTIHDASVPVNHVVGSLAELPTNHRVEPELAIPRETQSPAGGTEASQSPIAVAAAAAQPSGFRGAAELPRATSWQLEVPGGQTGASSRAVALTTPVTVGDVPMRGPITPAVRIEAIASRLGDTSDFRLPAMEGRPSNNAPELSGSETPHVGIGTSLAPPKLPAADAEVRPSPRGSATFQFEPLATTGQPRGGIEAGMRIAVQDAGSAAPTNSLLAMTTATPEIPGGSTAEFRIPDELAPPENLYPQRSPEVRQAIVERMGGSPETEKAVELALNWLARHQSDDGRWSGTKFDERCGQCGGQTSVEVDAALTGLALLCFLGADHTHVKDGPFKEHVHRGIHWLRSRQRPDGDLRGDETLYSQGIATIALSEAYGMTRDQRLQLHVQRAVDFIAQARNREIGGWRYDPGQVGDTSVLGWQVMALKSAKMAGLGVPADALEAARHWLRLVTTPSHPGRYAYQPGRPATPAMTAEAMFIQLLLGLHPEDPAIRASADYLAENSPDWEQGLNTYYWYYATLALYQQQAEHWPAWNRRLTEQLLAHQRKDGGAAGSWDPEGEWASTGGRVYQTALCTLMVEVYYRYLPLYSPRPQNPPIGSVEGSVTDAATGAALPGATVRLDVPDEDALTAVSKPDGHYHLNVPEVPVYFALTAVHQGYASRSVNVAAQSVRGTTHVQNFALQPARSDVIAIETVPEVHHLGDNNFEGRINSQFQKRAQGALFQAEFVLEGDVLRAASNGAELRMLAKGVQRRHEIRINDCLLERRLDTAPEDGSFGEFKAPFDGSHLRPGTNTFEIHATSLGGDIDDFEFVNIEIRLFP